MKEKLWKVSFMQPVNFIFQKITHNEILRDIFQNNYLQMPSVSVLFFVLPWRANKSALLNQTSVKLVNERKVMTINHQWVVKGDSFDGC